MKKSSPLDVDLAEFLLMLWHRQRALVRLLEEKEVLGEGELQVKIDCSLWRALEEGGD